MVSEEMRKLAEAWIAYNELDEKDTNFEYRWAEELVSDWRYDEPEKLWNFILTAYQMEMSMPVSAKLAAGAVEDLLADYGEKYIDRIEELARSDPRFNYLLGGVWRNSTSEEIWQRIEKVRLNVW